MKLGCSVGFGRGCIVVCYRVWILDFWFVSVVFGVGFVWVYGGVAVVPFFFFVCFLCHFILCCGWFVVLIFYLRRLLYVGLVCVGGRRIILSWSVVVCLFWVGRLSYVHFACVGSRMVILYVSHAV